MLAGWLAWAGAASGAEESVSDPPAAASSDASPPSRPVDGQPSARPADAQPSPERGYVPTPLAPGASATPNAWRAREGQAFKRDWGIEVLGIRSTSSGYMLTFRYRVIDPSRAKPLNEAKSKAYVIDEVSGARLAVPAMENIGELRQTTRPLADHTYFIVFGNPGQLVKRGGRVSLVIGKFRINNLIVE